MVLFSLTLAFLAAVAPCSATVIPSPCSPSGISPSSSSAVQAAFTSAHLVPDQVPSIKPKVALNVAYGSKAVNLGNTFTTPETLNAPTFDFSAEPGYDPATTKYLFIIVDPDAPSPTNPLLRSFLHEIVYNTQPSCIKSQKPITFVPYAPLTPLSVQSHRYTYLIYRQPPVFVIPPLQVAEVGRNNFNLAQFVQQGGLTLVGGNFMREGLGSNAPEVKKALCDAETTLANDPKLSPEQKAAVVAAEAALAKAGLGC